MTTVTFSLPDGDAEFEVTDFQIAGPYRWNEPPEPGEITLAATGTWDPLDGEPVRITIEGLIRMYMLVYRVDEARAAQMIEDEAFEDVSAQWADAFDEREGEP